MRYFLRRKQPHLTFSERLIAVAVLAVTLHFSFPQFSHAAVPIDDTSRSPFSDAFAMPFAAPSGASLTAVPESFVIADTAASVSAKRISARRTVWVLVTAYSSTEDQTDGSPYITAKNTFVRDGVVAANFLSFNTRLRIPQYSMEKELVVEDRMHERFSNRIDIWMPTRGEAKQWGARWVKVEVL